jgi:hypothetical protein
MIELFISSFLITLLAIALHSYSISKKNLFEPIYYILAGYFALFVLQAYQVRKILTYWHSEETINYGFLIAWLSIIIFYFGYRSKITKRLAKKIKVPDALPKGILLKPGLVFICIGIIAQLYIFSLAGGIESFYSEPRGVTNYATGGGYLYSIPLLIQVGLIILLVEAFKGSIRGIKRYLLYALSIFYVLYTAWMGSRSATFFVGLSIMAAVVMGRKRLEEISTKKTILAVLILVLLTGFVAKFRDEFYFGSEYPGIKSFLEEPAKEQALDLFFAPLGGRESHIFSERTEISMYLYYVSIFPDYINYDYGYTYSQFFFLWIPRSIWPEKPYRSEWGIINDIYSMLGFAHGRGPGVTMLGMYYMHLGIIGVLIGMYITGIVLGFLEYWRKQNPDNCFILICYLLFFSIGTTAMLGSGILYWLPVLLPFKILPLFLISFYLKKKQKKWAKRYYI